MNHNHVVKATTTILQCSSNLSEQRTQGWRGGASIWKRQDADLKILIQLLKKANLGITRAFCYP